MGMPLYSVDHFHFLQMPFPHSQIGALNKSSSKTTLQDKLVGNMASETTFDHWKVFFSWRKVRKRALIFQDGMARFYDLHFLNHLDIFILLDFRNFWVFFSIWPVFRTHVLHRFGHFIIDNDFQSFRFFKLEELSKYFVTWQEVFPHTIPPVEMSTT